MRTIRYIKYITFLVFLVCLNPEPIFSQHIQLTPDGFKYLEHTDKDYCVLNFEGKSAKELYENAIKYIHTVYKSPNDVLKGNIQNEFISFSTYNGSISKITNNLGGFRDLESKFTIALSFKDNKVKFEIVSYEMYFYHQSRKHDVLINSGGKFVWAIYLKNGKYQVPSMETTKKGIEDYFNATIKVLLEKLNNGSDDDDW